MNSFNPFWVLNGGILRDCTHTKWKLKTFAFQTIDDEEKERKC
jgi:hypothetical protein